MAPARSIAALGLLVFLTLSVACDGGPAGPTLPTGIEVVSGAGSTDTVMATSPQTLTVRVVGPDGKPLPGAVIWFEAWFDGGSPTAPTVTVGDRASSWFGSFVADSTDANGHASVRVRMGTRAGPGAVVMTVPALGVSDTARYTILAGKAVAVVALPSDTAVYLGVDLPLRSRVEDRFGNQADGTVAHTVLHDHAVLEADVLRSHRIGRVAVVADAAFAADTAWVTIVPRGTIAAYTRMEHTGHELAIYTFDLDGSNLTKRVSTVMGGGYWGEMPSVWSSDGKQLIYHDNSWNHTRQLWVHDVETGTGGRFFATDSGLMSEAWPRRSSDGEWIYFVGSSSYTSSEIFRVRPTGAGLQQVTRGAASNRHGASTSPDGMRMVYIDQLAVDRAVLEVMDIGTGAVTRIGTGMNSPRWSPSDDEIAYITTDFSDRHAVGELWTVRPDGTSRRRLTASAKRYHVDFDHSPDGKYIVAVSAEGALEVIDLATGESVTIRLPGLDHGLLAPSWKP